MKFMCPLLSLERVQIDFDNAFYGILLTILFETPLRDTKIYKIAINTKANT